MVGTIGAGTFAFILLCAILVALLALRIFCQVKIFRYIFLGYFGALIVVVVVMASIPYQTDEIVTETNSHFKVLLPFGILIFLGLILAVVFYLLVVLLHQDLARVLPT
jgi:Na+/proline symporter